MTTDPTNAEVKGLTEARWLLFVRDFYDAAHFPVHRPHVRENVLRLLEIIAERDRTIEELVARKDGAYEERNRVVALVARLALSLGWSAGVAKTAIEGWSEDWHNCVYIELPCGQASWHVHDSQMHLFDDLPPYDRNYDGHTTEEKYQRINAFRTLEATIADLHKRLDRIIELRAEDVPNYHETVEPIMKNAYLDGRAFAARIAKGDAAGQPTTAESEG